MTVRSRVLFFLVASITASVYARDWYVDDANGDDETGDGTQEAPFQTINRASTNVAFTAGETIFVAPGDYDKGGYVDGQGMTNRVYLPVQTTLKAISEDRRATRIVGAWDLSGGSAMKTGPAAVRCVRTLDSKTVISGFTICKGSTNSTGDDEASRGGGVYGNGTVTDCIIEDCRAFKGGGARDCTSVRTFFIGNKCTDGGGAQNGGRAYFCVFAGNGGVGTITTALSAHCTFLGSSANSIGGTCTSYNSLFCAEQTACPASVTLTNCIRSVTYDIVSPATEDYRLVKGCEAETAGDRNLLAQLPVAYRECDILGNPIPEEGPIPVGAVFASAEPAFGGLFFKNGSGLVDGRAYRAGTWLRPDAYPTQLMTIVPAPSDDGKPFLCFERAATDGGRAYAQMDGCFRLLPPPDAMAMSVLTAVYADKVIYVNANPQIGSDTAGTGSASAPYETLHKAITVAGSANAIIHAAAGDYRKGGKPLTEQSAKSVLTNVVNIGGATARCLIRGAGAATTFISGAPDPETAGFGPKAVRAVVLFSQYAALQGFTIRDSYSNTSDCGVNHDKYGVMLRTYNAGEAVSQLLDCVVTNCHSVGNGFNDGGLGRCRIVGNSFGSSIAYNTWISSCEVVGNAHETYSGLHGTCRLFGCTVVGRDTDDQTMNSGASGFYLTVFDTGKIVYSDGTYGGNIAHNIATVQSGTVGFVQGDPAFVDVARGDFRTLKSGIAGTASGNVTNQAWFASVWPFLGSDIMGRNRSFGGGGSLVVGAYGEQVDAIVVSAEKGGLSVEGATGTVIPVSATTRITISLDPSAAEPCIGFTANGVTNLFAETPSVVFTAADVAAAGGALAISALYSPDWHVDGVNGSDGNSGMNPNDAFLTLPRALTNGLLKAGQTVHVAPGLYAESKMKNAAGSKIYARAVVKSGVTLLADQGPAATEIRGADGDDEGHSLGLGTNAVRCIFLEANATVRGFTLSGGRTLPPSKVETGSEKIDSDWVGGAACGGNNSQVVEDCIITNCCANRGGGTYRVTLRNCRVIDNHAVNSAAASYYDGCYGTVFARNSGGTYPVMYPVAFVNCTLAEGASGALQMYAVNSFPMLNSLVMGGSYFGIAAGGAASRCIFTVQPSESAANTFDPYGDGGFCTNSSAVTVDAEYRPVVGACVAVDAAMDDGNYVRKLTGRDASGGQRVYNGVLDVGALEADYRPVFAVAMGRGITVLEADSTVTRTAEGVVLTNGSLTAVWHGRQPGCETGYEYTLAVAGGGELTAVVGTVTTRVDTVTGPMTLGFRSSEATIPMCFIFTPPVGMEGRAVLSSFRRQAGLMLIVR